MMGEEPLSCWPQCLHASKDLERALDPPILDQLSNQLDLPADFKGAGLHSLVNSADEEFLGSFASISFALISISRQTNMPVYPWIADSPEETDISSVAVRNLKAVGERARTEGGIHSKEDIETAT